MGFSKKTFSNSVPKQSIVLNSSLIKLTSSVARNKENLMPSNPKPSKIINTIIDPNADAV
jgi:hypothetical protein